MAEQIKKTSTRRARVAAKKVSSRGLPRISRTSKREAPVAGDSGKNFKTRGFSLRWKIVAAIAAVTFLSGLLIFIVVYGKAVDQLDAEIDAKGERLVSTLASIDESYWYHAIHRPDQRMSTVNTFLHEIDPTDKWRDRIKTDEAANDQYKKLVRSEGGDSQEEIRASISCRQLSMLLYSMKRNRY